MELAKKLQLKDGVRIHVVGAPAGLKLDVPQAPVAKADGVLVFVKNSRDLATRKAPVIAAAREDRPAWIVYPKDRQLGTDLNRDIIWKGLLKDKIQGVRQVSIDEVWSAMRFRPEK